MLEVRTKWKRVVGRRRKRKAEEKKQKERGGSYLSYYMEGGWRRNVPGRVRNEERVGSRAGVL